MNMKLFPMSLRSIENQSGEDDALSSPGVSNQEMEPFETRISEMDNDIVEQLDKGASAKK